MMTDEQDLSEEKDKSCRLLVTLSNASGAVTTRRREVASLVAVSGLPESAAVIKSVKDGRKEGTGREAARKRDEPDMALPSPELRDLFEFEGT